jgi:ferric-dicitrate binding protein FerR (iron transport regulator)
MSKVPSDIDLTLVAKYFAGEADLDEINLVEHWAGESAEHKEEFDKLQKSWALATAGIGMQEWNILKSKEKFLFRIIQAQAIKIDDKEKSISQNRKFIRNLMKYAAAAVILIGLSSVIVYTFYISDREKLMTEQSQTEISVSDGSKSFLTLADGSKVWLNAGSKIRYDRNYNKKARNIYLTGEAYFNVAKNQHKSFNVHAGGIVVQAIGTVFNVKAYPEEKLIETTLLEGSVSIDLNNKSTKKIILEPKEQMLYYKPGSENGGSGRAIITKGIETELYTSWINNKLAINNETLESLTVKLSRKYDVAFHFEDESLKDLRFTGELKNETIEQILEILEISSTLNFQIKGRNILIKKNEHKQNVKKD